MYESFLYRREKAAGEKVYWTCRDQARMGCRSRAITQGQRVMVMRRHCHPPDLGGLEALRQREQLPSPAQREGSGVGERRAGRGRALVFLLAQQPLGTAQNTGWRLPAGTFLLWPMSSGVCPPGLWAPLGQGPHLDSALMALVLIWDGLSFEKPIQTAGENGARGCSGITGSCRKCSAPICGAVLLDLGDPLSPLSLPTPASAFGPPQPQHVRSFQFRFLKVSKGRI